MLFEFNNDEPLYRQIANQIEEGIFIGIFPPDSQVPSTTELSRQFNLNPATVLKGMNQLVTAGLIEKKRGLGMFVTETAPAQITEKRQAAFYQQHVQDLVKEAKQLNLTKTALLALIERGYDHE